MKKSLFYMLILLSIVFALTGCLPKTAGQEPPLPVVNIKAILPEDTPEDGTVYIVGNYSDWGFDNAATSDVKTDDEGKKYAEFELDFKDAEYPLEYKYTYGAAWDYEELDEKGDSLDGNRRIDVKPDKDIQDVVLNWKGKDKIDYTDSQEEITVTFVVNVPEGTEDDDGKIYMKGSFNNWSEGTPLVKTQEGTYTGNVEVQSYTTLRFKFLRKDEWGFEEIVGSNRIAILSDDSTITCFVEKWKN